MPVPWLPQNPGIGGVDELTSAEETVVQRIAALNPVAGAILYYGTGQWDSLAIGSAGQVLTVSSGLPAWVANATGDFSGPASSTDNAVVRFDGTGGKTGQNSVVLIDDTGNISGALNISGGSLTVSDAPTTRTNLGLGTTNAPQFARLGLGIAADGTDELNLPLTGQIVVAGGNPRRSIVLTGAGGWSAATFGASGNTKNAVGTGGTATEGAKNYYALGFDVGTLEFAQWSVVMPDNYDGGDLIAKFYWTSAATSGDVIFGIQGRSYGDDEALDQSWSSARLVTDTMGNAASDVMISGETASLTLAGTPAGGEFVQFRVYRDGGSGADTLAAEASLMMVKLEFGISQYSDAT